MHTLNHGSAGTSNNRLVRPPSTAVHYFTALVATLALGQAGSASAAPGVSGVSSALSDGATVTITGSSFGSGPTVVLFDDFESGTVGAPIKTGPGSARVGQWVTKCISSQTDTTYYTDSAKLSGNKSFQADLAIGYPGNCYRRNISLPSVKDVFVSRWQFLPVGDNWPGEGHVDRINWKTIWVFGDDTSAAGNDFVAPVILGPKELTDPNSTSELSVLFSGNATVVQQGENRPHQYLAKDTFRKGLWVRAWFWLKGSTTSTSADGAVKFWSMDETKGLRNQINKTGVNTLADGGSFKNINMAGLARTPTVNSHPTYDDVYVASGPNAQARVEVGNASTYADCTNLTILTPTSWSADRIAVQVNQGSFADGPAYLYVFDADGVANPTGYPVTFGKTIPQDPTAPAAPTGLRVP